MSLIFNRRLYIIIIITYVVAGILGGSYIAFKSAPEIQGYAFLNWPSTYFVKYANITKEGPELVISNGNRTLLYNGNKWSLINFETEALCKTDSKLILAGGLDGKPSILIIGNYQGNNNSALEISFRAEGSLTSIACGKSLIVGAGSFPSPFLILYDSNNYSVKLYTFLNSSLNSIKEVKIVDKKIFVVFKSFREMYYLLSISGNNSKGRSLVYNNSVNLVTIISNGTKAVIDGYFTKNGTDISFLKPFGTNKVRLFRFINGKGISILSAKFFLNNTARFYIRSRLGLWDGLAEAYNDRLWFSRLLWPYNHVVVFEKMDSMGKAVIAAVLYTKNGNILVLTRGFSLRSSVLWMDNHPLFYIKKPIWGQKIIIKNVKGFLANSSKIIYQTESIKYLRNVLTIKPITVVNMSHPIKLTTKVNRVMVFSLNALYGVIFAVLVYEAFRPFKV